MNKANILVFGAVITIALLAVSHHLISVVRHSVRLSVETPLVFYNIASHLLTD